MAHCFKARLLHPAAQGMTTVLMHTATQERHKTMQVPCTTKTQSPAPYNWQTGQHVHTQPANTQYACHMLRRVQVKQHGGIPNSRGTHAEERFALTPLGNLHMAPSSLCMSLSMPDWLQRCTIFTSCAKVHFALAGCTECSLLSLSLTETGSKSTIGGVRAHSID